MGKTARPRTHAQRDTINRAIAKLIASKELQAKGMDQVIGITLDNLLIPARDRYLRARRTYRVARAAEKLAATAVRNADTAYDAAFRTWNKSVQDAKGNNLPRQLSQLTDNVLPGDLIQLPYDREIALTTSLLEQLVHLPHLRGDPDDLAKLEVAHATLSEKAAAASASELARREAKRDLDALTLAFDQAWMDTVRIIRGANAKLARTVLPVFDTPKKTRSKPALPPVVVQPPVPVPSEAIHTEPAPAPVVVQPPELLPVEVIHTEVVPDEPEEEDLGDENEETLVLTPTDSIPPLP